MSHHSRSVFSLREVRTAPHKDFKVLAAREASTLSIRTLADCFDMNYVRVHRLVSGKIIPGVQTRPGRRKILSEYQELELVDRIAIKCRDGDPPTRKQLKKLVSS